MILGKHTLIKLIFLVLAILALSSCSSRPEQVEVKAEEEELRVEEEIAPTAEAEAREAVYIYKAHPGQVSSDKITLAMNDDPLLLPDGYVRLVGVVSGGKPIAVIEVGGRGVVVERGDQVCGYTLILIDKGKILLKRCR